MLYTRFPSMIILPSRSSWCGPPLSGAQLAGPSVAAFARVARPCVAHVCASPARNVVPMHVVLLPRGAAHRPCSVFPVLGGTTAPQLLAVSFFLFLRERSVIWARAFSLALPGTWSLFSRVGWVNAWHTGATGERTACPRVWDSPKGRENACVYTFLQSQTSIT